MKRFIPFIMLAGIGVLANPVRADITTKFSSSVQLSVGGASTQAERIGSSFSISGSNIDTTDGTTAGTVSAGTITSGVYSPVTVGASQNFGDIYSVASGTTGDLAGQVTSAHTFASVDAGGANTAVTTQFVSEVTVR